MTTSLAKRDHFCSIQLFTLSAGRSNAKHYLIRGKQQTKEKRQQQQQKRICFLLKSATLKGASHEYFHILGQNGGEITFLALKMHLENQDK